MVMNFVAWSQPRYSMVATMTQEMVEDYGSILLCGRDHGTLCDELCSVVATIIFHNHDHRNIWSRPWTSYTTIVCNISQCSCDLGRNYGTPCGESKS